VSTWWPNWSTLLRKVADAPKKADLLVALPAAAYKPCDKAAAGGRVCIDDDAFVDGGLATFLTDVFTADKYREVHIFVFRGTSVHPSPDKDSWQGRPGVDL
jgi:hypothetical protein